MSLYIKRILSILLSVSMALTSTYGYGYPTLFGSKPHAKRYLTDDSLAEKTNIAVNPGSITIPESIGKVLDAYKGKGDSLVIHIQDRHIDPVAQLNIAKIIDEFNIKHDIHLMCLEGASKELNTSFYNKFPDSKIKTKVAEFFVGKGLFTGAEFYKITNTDKYLKAQGAEDKAAYLEHLASYKDNEIDKDKILKFLKAVETSINILKDKAYSKLLKDIDKKASLYYTKQLKLPEYLKALQYYSKKAEADISEYKNLNKFIKLIEKEKDIDFKAAQAQREELIKHLSENLENEKLQELLKNSLDFKLNKLSDITFYTYLEEFLKSKTYNLELTTYNCLISYIDYLKFSKEIDPLKVFDEAEDVEEKLMLALSKTPIQKDLVSYSKSTKILQGLYNLKLTRRQLDYINDHSDYFDISRIQHFVKQACTKYGLNPTSSLRGEAEAIPKAVTNKESIDNSKRYYQLALKRDIALVNNTLKAMSRGRKDRAILITGGFHTQGITNILKDKDISYVVICPGIGTEDCEKLYSDRMAGRLPDIAELTESFKHTLLPLSGYSDMCPPQVTEYTQNAFEKILNIAENGTASDAEKTLEDSNPESGIKTPLTDREKDLLTSLYKDEIRDRQLSTIIARRLDGEITPEMVNSWFKNEVTIISAEHLNDSVNHRRGIIATLYTGTLASDDKIYFITFSKDGKITSVALRKEGIYEQSAIGHGYEYFKIPDYLADLVTERLKNANITPKKSEVTGFLLERPWIETEQDKADFEDALVSEKNRLIREFLFLKMEKGLNFNITEKYIFIARKGSVPFFYPPSRSIYRGLVFGVKDLHIFIHEFIHGIYAKLSEEQKKEIDEYFRSDHPELHNLFETERFKNNKQNLGNEGLALSLGIALSGDYKIGDMYMSLKQKDLDFFLQLGLIPKTLHNEMSKQLAMSKQEDMQPAPAVSTLKSSSSGHSKIGTLSEEQIKSGKEIPQNIGNKKRQEKNIRTENTNIQEPITYRKSKLKQKILTSIFLTPLFFLVISFMQVCLDGASVFTRHRYQQKVIERTEKELTSSDLMLINQFFSSQNKSYLEMLDKQPKKASTLANVAGRLDKQIPLRDMVKAYLFKGLNDFNTDGYIGGIEANIKEVFIAMKSDLRYEMLAGFDNWDPVVFNILVDLLVKLKNGGVEELESEVDPFLRYQLHDNLVLNLLRYNSLGKLSNISDDYASGLTSDIVRILLANDGSFLEQNPIFSAAIKNIFDEELNRIKPVLEKTLLEGTEKYSSRKQAAITLLVGQNYKNFSQQGRIRARPIYEALYSLLEEYNNKWCVYGFSMHLIKDKALVVNLHYEDTKEARWYVKNTLNRLSADENEISEYDSLKTSDRSFSLEKDGIIYNIYLGSRNVYEKADIIAVRTHDDTVVEILKPYGYLPNKNIVLLLTCKGASKIPEVRAKFGGGHFVSTFGNDKAVSKFNDLIVSYLPAIIKEMNGKGDWRTVRNELNEYINHELSLMQQTKKKDYKYITEYYEYPTNAVKKRLLFPYQLPIDLVEELPFNAYIMNMVENKSVIAQINIDTLSDKQKEIVEAAAGMLDKEGRPILKLVSENGIDKTGKNAAALLLAESKTKISVATSLKSSSAGNRIETIFNDYIEESEKNISMLEVIISQLKNVVPEQDLLNRKNSLDSAKKRLNKVIDGRIAIEKIASKKIDEISPDEFIKTLRKIEDGAVAKLNKNQQVAGRVIKSALKRDAFGGLETFAEYFNINFNAEEILFIPQSSWLCDLFDFGETVMGQVRLITDNKDNSANLILISTALESTPTPIIEIAKVILHELFHSRFQKAREYIIENKPEESMLFCILEEAKVEELVLMLLSEITDNPTIRKELFSHPAAEKILNMGLSKNDAFLLMLLELGKFYYLPEKKVLSSIQNFSKKSYGATMEFLLKSSSISLQEVLGGIWIDILYIIKESPIFRESGLYQFNLLQIARLLRQEKPDEKIRALRLWQGVEEELLLLDNLDDHSQIDMEEYLQHIHDASFTVIREVLERESINLEKIQPEMKEAIRNLAMNIPNFSKSSSAGKALPELLPEYANNPGMYKDGAAIDLRGTGKQVILIGDLHARVDNFDAILSDFKSRGLMQKIIDKEAVLIFLGDAVHSERNLIDMDSSIEMIQKIIQLKVTYPDNVYYILGNHDYLSDRCTKGYIPQGIFFAKALEKKFSKEITQQYIDLFIQNSAIMLTADGLVATHAGPVTYASSFEEVKRTDPRMEGHPIVKQAQWLRWGLDYGEEEIEYFRAKIAGQPNAFFIVAHSPHLIEDEGDFYAELIENHYIIYAARDNWGYAIFDQGELELIDSRGKKTLSQITTAQKEIPQLPIKFSSAGQTEVVWSYLYSSVQIENLLRNPDIACNKYRLSASIDALQEKDIERIEAQYKGRLLGMLPRERYRAWMGLDDFAGALERFEEEYLSGQEANSDDRLLDELLKSLNESGNKVLAHGVARAGGIEVLLNIMLEERVHSSSDGRSYFAKLNHALKSYGPYYVALDSDKMREDNIISDDNAISCEGHLLADYHSYYIVPSENAKKLLIKGLSEAAGKNLFVNKRAISKEYAEAAASKLKTYEEFIAEDYTELTPIKPSSAGKEKIKTVDTEKLGQVTGGIYGRFRDKWEEFRVSFNEGAMTVKQIKRFISESEKTKEIVWEDTIYRSQIGGEGHLYFPGLKILGGGLGASGKTTGMREISRLIEEGSDAGAVHKEYDDCILPEQRRRIVNKATGETTEDVTEKFEQEVFEEYIWEILYGITTTRTMFDRKNRGRLEIERDEEGRIIIHNEYIHKSKGISRDLKITIGDQEGQPMLIFNSPDGKQKAAKIMKIDKREFYLEEFEGKAVLGFEDTKYIIEKDRLGADIVFSCFDRDIEYLEESLKRAADEDRQGIIYCGKDQKGEAFLEFNGSRATTLKIRTLKFSIERKKNLYFVRVNNNVYIIPDEHIDQAVFVMSTKWFSLRRGERRDLEEVLSSDSRVLLMEGVGATANNELNAYDWVVTVNFDCDFDARWVRILIRARDEARGISEDELLYKRIVIQRTEEAPYVIPWLKGCRIVCRTNSLAESIFEHYKDGRLKEFDDSLHALGLKAEEIKKELDSISFERLKSIIKEGRFIIDSATEGYLQKVYTKERGNYGLVLIFPIRKGEFCQEEGVFSEKFKRLNAESNERLGGLKVRNKIYDISKYGRTILPLGKKGTHRVKEVLVKNNVYISLEHALDNLNKSEAPDKASKIRHLFDMVFGLRQETKEEGGKYRKDESFFEAISRRGVTGKFSFRDIAFSLVINGRTGEETIVVNEDKELTGELSGYAPENYSLEKMTGLQFSKEEVDYYNKLISRLPDKKAFKERYFNKGIKDCRKVADPFDKDIIVEQIGALTTIVEQLLLDILYNYYAEEREKARLNKSESFFVWLRLYKRFLEEQNRQTEERREIIELLGRLYEEAEKAPEIIEDGKWRDVLKSLAKGSIRLGYRELKRIEFFERSRGGGRQDKNTQEISQGTLKSFSAGRTLEVVKDLRSSYTRLFEDMAKNPYECYFGKSPNISPDRYGLIIYDSTLRGEEEQLIRTLALLKDFNNKPKFEIIIVPSKDGRNLIADWGISGENIKTAASFLKDAYRDIDVESEKVFSNEETQAIEAANILKALMPVGIIADADVNTLKYMAGEINTETKRNRDRYVFITSQHLPDMAPDSEKSSLLFEAIFADIINKLRNYEKIAQELETMPLEERLEMLFEILPAITNPEFIQRIEALKISLEAVKRAA